MSNERRIILFQNSGSGSSSDELLTNFSFNLSELSRKILLIAGDTSDPTLSPDEKSTGLYQSIYGYTLLPHDLFAELARHDRPRLAKLFANGFDFILINGGAPDIDAFLQKLVDEVVILMEPNLDSLESGYTRIKSLHLQETDIPVYLLYYEVNPLNRKYFFTLQDMTRRFLNRQYPVLAEVPSENYRLQKHQLGIPVSYLYPGRDYSKELRKAARLLLHIDVRLASIPGMKVLKRTNWVTNDAYTENH